jgi:hypothetical protein
MNDYTTVTIRTTEEIKKVIKLNALMSNLSVKDYITKLVLEDNKRIFRKNGKKLD